MKKKKILTIFLVVFLILVAGGAWYVNDYYRSDDRVKQYFNRSEEVQLTEMADGLFLDGPGEEAAFIFYPGAKVEYTAYVPLMYELAANGVDVFLVKMPCNLAFFGMNKADAIRESYSYENWYLGGHSLGGAMAASYAAKHLEQFNGMVFLASYPTVNLKADHFSAISIYGSEDGVLNMEKVEQGRNYMPANYKEVCIEGGNHAQFGAYGFQKKDGIATITEQEQQEQTVQSILNFIIQ